MSTKNLISVIMPAYNHEKYVQEAIQSVINQTYQNIELIIIDDGSKDSTWQKIQELKPLCEKRFVRVIFETQENQGTCRTLNKLISYVNGDYLFLIASDDKMKPQAIELECNFLSKHPDYALCVGDDEIIDSDSKVCYWDNERNIVYDESKAAFKTFATFLQKALNLNFNSKEFGRYDKLYQTNHIPNGYLIRKSIFEKIGQFTVDAPLEDYWLALQISKYAKMKYIDKILYSYRWHTANTIKNIENMIAITEKTRANEENILKHVDLNTILPIVKMTYLYGLRQKVKGIPFVFQIFKYIKNNKKTKIIKLFNIPIFKYTKPI